MADLIRNGEKEEFRPLQLGSTISPQFPKEKYCKMVEKAKHYIHEGDIFQVVLSNPMRAKAEGSLFDTYRVLRATNPSPYMFYFPVMISKLQVLPRKHLSSWKTKTDYFSTGRNKTERQDKAGRSGTGRGTSERRKGTCRTQYAGGSWAK